MQDDNDKNLTDDTNTKDDAPADMTPDTDTDTDAAEENASEEVAAPEATSEESASTSTPATAGGTDDRGRTLYNVKCSNCGRDTQVPFQPSEGRPVYCRDCFMRMKNS